MVVFIAEERVVVGFYVKIFFLSSGSSAEFIDIVIYFILVRCSICVCVCVDFGLLPMSSASMLCKINFQMVGEDTAKI